MSEIISDTAKLDEVQQEPETKQEEYFTNLKNFVYSTFSSGVKLIFGFIISLFLIYACKISQANVLPTDINCFPYTKEVNNPTPIQTNIFTNSPFSKPRKSMKMSFDVEGSEFVNSMLKSFRDYKEDNTSSFLGMYFYSIMESMFMKNYLFYNYILTFIDALPEFILVFFGPYIGLCIFIFSCIYNAIYFTWFWFYNLSWMWKKNDSIQINKESGEVVATGDPKWIDVRWGTTQKLPDGKADYSKSEWANVLVGLIFIILFIGLYVVLLLFQGLLVIPLIFNLIVLYSFLTYNMKLADNDASFTDLFQYFFRYNKLLIMTCFAFYVVYNAYTYLGATSAVFAVLTIFLIYYLKIVEMFVSVGTEDERTSPLVSNKQAKKVACEKPKIKYVKSNDESIPLLDKKEVTGDAEGSGDAKGSGKTDTEKKSWRDQLTPSFMKSKPKSDANPEGPKDIELTDMSRDKSALVTSEGDELSQEKSKPSNSFKFPSLNLFGKTPASNSKQPVTPAGNIEQPLIPASNSKQSVIPEGNITKLYDQLGGSKTTQIGGKQLIRRLKDFNKKYAQFLL